MLIYQMRNYFDEQREEKRMDKLQVTITYTDGTVEIHQWTNGKRDVDRMCEDLKDSNIGFAEIADKYINKNLIKWVEIEDIS